jgi:hypothetical protein
MHLRSGRRAKLGVGCGSGGEDRNGGKAEQKAGALVASGKATGKYERKSHSSWTAP